MSALHHRHSFKAPWSPHLLPLPLLLLLILSAASHAAALLFGLTPDPLAPVRNALDQRTQQRKQLLAWNQANISEMQDWSFQYDTDALTPLLSHFPLDLAIHDGAAYYHNLSGFYRGHWAAREFGSTNTSKHAPTDIHKQQQQPLPYISSLGQAQAQQLHRDQPAPANTSTALADHRGTFNWLATTSSQSRQLNFNLNQDHTMPGLVSVVRGGLSLEAPSSPNARTSQVDFDLHGLHFPRTGTLYLIATAQERQQATDLRNILGMIPKHDTSINLTVSALEKDLDERIQRLNDIIASRSYNPGDDSDAASSSPVHNCSLHIYAKLRPAGSANDIDLVQTLELEQEVPTGISTIHAAPLALTALMYSPECHLLLSSDDIDGLTKTRLWRKAIHYAFIYFVVLLVQARLLVQQMQATSTPSGLAKVSYRTWGMQSMLDAYIGLAHLSVGIALNNATTLPLLACAFMSCMLFLAFGYRYALTIYRTQAPETEGAAPVPAAPAAAPAATPAAATGNVDAATATTPPAGPPTALPSSPPPSDPETRRRSFFIVLFILILFLSIFFPLFFAEILLPILYSFWIPQIRRNMQRGTRRSVSTRCVVGTTMCRLVLPLYLFACPDNVLFTWPNGLVWILVGWVVGQMLMLLGQDWIGVEWFVPSRWRGRREEGWDWYPPIETISEGTLGDCAICLNNITLNDGSMSTTMTTTRRRRRSKKNGGKTYDSIPLQKEDQEEKEKEEEEEEDSLSDLEGGSIFYPPDKIDPASPRTIQPRHVLTRWTRTTTRTIRGLWERTGWSVLHRKRREVMVAPCKHIFHTECLERWLTIKTECPSCRRPLPAV